MFWTATFPPITFNPDWYVINWEQTDIQHTASIQSSFEDNTNVYISSPSKSAYFLAMIDKGSFNAFVFSTLILIAVPDSSLIVG